MNGFIGETLTSLRLQEGLKRKELAEKVFVTERAIEYYERNKRMPRADILISLANHFSVSVDYLLGR